MNQLAITSRSKETLIQRIIERNLKKNKKAALSILFISEA